MELFDAFSEWWKELDIFTQVLYCVALPSTLILIIQTVMIILGFGHDGAGVNPSDTSGFDGGHDLSFDADTGGDIDISGHDPGDINTDIDYTDGSSPGDFGTMNFFTVQGIVTFLCVFGWTGVIVYGAAENILISILTAFVLGAAAMYGVARLLWASKKLAHNGTLNVKNLLGASGTVYLIIPPCGEGSGKVNITSGERYLEFSAITDERQPLPDGTPIRVIDIRSGNILVVERI